MEQEEPGTQHPEQNVVQMLEENGVHPLPDDEVLRAAVDSIIVDGEVQNQKQEQENQGLKQQLNIQTEEIHSLQEKLEHLINVQIQTSQQLKVLQDVISQVPGIRSAVTLTVPKPSIDDRQSIDSLLADDEGQEMEQDKPGTQHAEQNSVQMLDGNGVHLSPEDEVLHIAVNSIIVDGEEQNQKQEQ